MRSETRRGSSSKQVGRDDLEVVVGRVGEGAAAVAIPEGIETIGTVGLQLDRSPDDVATLVRLATPARSKPKSSVLGVAAYGEQHVRPLQLTRPPSAQSRPTATRSPRFE